MKLNKGGTIRRHGVGVLSRTSYTVTVKISANKATISISTGEDARGNFVVIKVIATGPKMRYWLGRTYLVPPRHVGEHRLLALGHPCLPEPLAMLLIENNSSDDQRLFRKIAQWDSLRYQEPILIQEYFSGSPLTTLTDKLHCFLWNDDWPWCAK